MQALFALLAIDRLLDSICECRPNLGRHSIRVVSVLYSGFLGDEGLVSIGGEVCFPPYCTQAAISGHMIDPLLHEVAIVVLRAVRFSIFPIVRFHFKRIYR